MIAYDPKNWWSVICSIHGTVLRDVAPAVATLTVFSLALVVWDKNADGGIPHIDPVGHTILGVVLGLLIVFRTNSSYERFWEGRRLWGQMVNTSRSLARGAAVYAGPAAELARLLTGYVHSVKHHLRGERDLAPIRQFLPESEFSRIEAAGNPPSQIAALMSRWNAERISSGRLTPMLGAELERQVTILLDCQGGCERIHKTPIPFVYAAHIKHLLLLYLGTLPIVLVEKLGYSAPIAVAIMTFGLLGIQEAGLEIEDPFGTDPNDLPLDDICATIARDVHALADFESAADEAANRYNDRA